MMEVDGEDAAEETVSQMIPFYDFVNMLEKVSTTKDRDEKNNRIKKYFDHYRRKFRELHGHLDSEAAHGDSIFSIVRLLCPTWDRERSSFGIKDIVMGRVFAKIHKISPTDSDGKQLLNYKNPAIVGEVAAGDIALVIFRVLGTRSSHSDPERSPKISELHAVLDQLAKNKGDEEAKVTQEMQVTILQGLVQRLGALEGKWLAKIILKRMDLGINESSILGLLHPKAKELLDTMSLHKVCQVCNDPDNADVPTGKVFLFSYFKPMLCTRLDLRSGRGNENADKVIISKSKRNPITLPPPPFLVETKFDGERFQIHFQRGGRGEAHIFKYFSRGGFEYKEFNETLTPRLQKQLVSYSSVDSFVIDGEMMAYNFKNKSFTAKGKSMDVKTLLESDTVHCPAYVAWDLVYLNGDSLCHEPLARRLELLQEVLQPKESVYYISDQQKCDNLEGVIQLLDKAIENCEEGVVIKHQHSQYEPGQRKLNWLKLKPEYVEGYRVDDMDLLIVGGYYADTSRRGGTITSLVVGVLDGEDVYPIAKVGCGRLKHHELAALVESLEPHFVTRDIPAIKYKGKRPDVLIYPNESVVLEVNASEINPSKDYHINYALRFPVISRVRRDKSWYEAMTVSEFHKLRESCKQGKMVTGKRGGNAPGHPYSKYPKTDWGPPVKFEHGSSDDEVAGSSRGFYHRKPNTSSTAATKKTRAIYISPSKIKEIESKVMAESNRLNAVKVESSNLFLGKVFNVIGTSTWKTQMEEKLKNHGAEVVKNPTADTCAIVAEKLTEPVKRKMNLGKWEVLDGAKWVDRCISSNEIQNFVPLDLLFATEETKASFVKDFDIYGDSYTHKLTVPETKQLLEKVIQGDSKKAAGRDDFAKLKKYVQRQLRREDRGFSRWSIFENCKIGFLPTVHPVYKSAVQFYGGEVLEDWTSPEATHLVILNGHDIPSTVNSSLPILHENWIQTCLDEKALVNVDIFVKNI